MLAVIGTNVPIKRPFRAEILQRRARKLARKKMQREGLLPMKGKATGR